MPRTFSARRYDTGQPVQITLDGDRIAAVAPVDSAQGSDALPFVAPGLFDLQINGYGGVWFADSGLTAEQVSGVMLPYVQRGIVRVCPTLITSSFESLAAGFTAIRRACERDPWIARVVAGCHLEGPYLSSEDGPRGAHPREHIRPADWNEFAKLQDISGNRIRLITIAPEAAHAVEFIRRAVAAGVVVAIGHTAATSEQIAAAVDAGATLSTHLGNGAHPVMRRHPNIIWDQLGEPRLSASLITDGEHLPDSVVRSIVWAKSPARCILTCDASGWAGCAPGVYKNDLAEVEVLAEGRIVVAGQQTLLAGSGATTEQCVSRAVKSGACTWREAIDMACRNPTRLLGLEERRLVAGDPADLFLYRIDEQTHELQVVATFLAGELHAAEPRAGQVA